MTKPNWSWADYEREKRKEERKAAQRAARISSVRAQEGQTADDASGCKGRAAEVTNGPAPVEVTASPHVAVKARQSRVEFEPRPPKPSDAWRGDRRPLLARMRGPAALPDTTETVAPVAAPFSPGGKIDITAAPSGMEAAAARWEGKGHAPGQLAQPVPVLCEGKVMCRCGAQGPGQTRGLVPVWFGDKCIEANCELRGDRCAAPQARPRAAANAAKPSGADATRPAFEGPDK